MMAEDEHIKYWIESSDKDYKTMCDLFSTKNYNWSLFIGHLVIEKLLKALYIKENNEIPPLIHDLRRIAEKADLKLDDEQMRILDAITRFNINARYDDYKDSFYTLCTPEFSKEWIEKIKKTRLWIKTLL
jgi:HEPN domain-containing protein